jgi:type 1 glutamine amidotransferase
MHEEEWYSFVTSPRAVPGVHVLASVDESTYEPRERIAWVDRDISMGDHPIVWLRCVGRGRALYAAPGHQAAAYAEGEFAELLDGAVAWAMGLSGNGCASAGR